MDGTPAKERLREELARLTAIDGVSGHETAVVAYLREAFEPLADRVEIDVMGNLYASRSGGSGPHVMVEAHSDEIGALVAAIEPTGFLRLERVGGAPEAMLAGRKVRVGGHLGVIGVRPGHLLSEQESRAVPAATELYVDLGLDSRAEVEGLGVRIGDQIVWQSELEPTANPDRVVGKAIDNRLGCTIVLELLRHFQGRDLPGPLTAVVAVQEEVGLKGARVAAERVRPDAALVIDTCPSPDTPDAARSSTFPVRIGAGPVIQVSSGARGRGFLMSEPVRSHAIAVAEAAGIPYQLASFAYGNTDASAIYDAAGGVPTIPITIPRRYSHSPVELLDLNDAVVALQLCVALVERAAELLPGPR